MTQSIYHLNKDHRHKTDGFRATEEHNMSISAGTEFCNVGKHRVVLTKKSDENSDLL